MYNFLFTYFVQKKKNSNYVMGIMIIEFPYLFIRVFLPLE